MREIEIAHYPRQRRTKYDARAGERMRMRCGLMGTVIEYHNRHDITVMMSDGTVLYKRSYTDFMRGEIDPERVSKKYKEETR